MFKVDYNKLKTHDLTAIIMGNYGRSEPKLFTFIHKIYENKQGYITGLEYMSENGHLIFWCNANQIDDAIGYKENKYKIENLKYYQ